MMLLLLSLFACDDFLVQEPEADAPPDPGTRVLQRLNRAEYDNSVRDLLGTTLRPSVDFPADDFGYGFDNIGDVLSMSPLHLELYDRATVNLLDELFGTAVAPTERWVFEAEDAEAVASGGAPFEVTGWTLYGDDDLQARAYIPYDGTYVVAAWAWPRTGGHANVALLVDDEEVVSQELIAPERVEATLSLTQGHHTVGIAFLDPPEDPSVDEDLVVDWLEITGPTDRPLPPPALASKVLSCSPDDMAERDCALQIVRDWVLRFNADGPDGLATCKAPGRTSILNDEQRARLSGVVETGPIAAAHGVVRWRLADLAQWVWDEFSVSVTRHTLGHELRAMGYRKLSARPRHRGQKDDDIAIFKKASPSVWRKSAKASPKERP